MKIKLDEKADVIVMPRALVPSGHEPGPAFDRSLASLPAAPVVALESLDRADLYR